MIQWVTKQRLKKNDYISVSIHVYNNGYLDFSFFGNAHKKITAHDYLMCGVDFEQNRIYFQSGTPVNGYKIKLQGSVAHIKIKNQLSEKLKPAVGVYDLLFDDDQKLYYIQLENNE